MATRGSIPQMMERAGIEMLPPEAGIPVVRRELEAPGPGGEVVVAGSLGLMLEPRDADGGLDPSAFAPSGPMAGRIAGLGVDGALAVEAELVPGEQPFLDHHRIDGTPVLPGVMGLEAFTEATRFVVPGLHVVAVENADFLAPFKLYRDEPRTVRVEVLVEPDGDGAVARCRLLGSRLLAGRDEPQETVHFAASVRLASAPPRPVEGGSPNGATGESVGVDDVYRVLFHGPAYRVLERAWRDGEVAVGRFAADLPPNHRPEDLPAVLAPRWIELCFQTAGLLEIGATGRMGLPLHVDRVVVVPGAEPDGPVHAVVAVDGTTDGSTNGGGTAYDASIVDGAGRVLARVEGDRTVELPGGVEAEVASKLKAVMG